LRRYKRKSVEVSVSRRGVFHFERRFRREGSVAQQPLLVGEEEWRQLQRWPPALNTQNLVWSASA